MNQDIQKSFDLFFADLRSARGIEKRLFDLEISDTVETYNIFGKEGCANCAPHGVVVQVARGYTGDLEGIWLRAAIEWALQPFGKRDEQITRLTGGKVGRSPEYRTAVTNSTERLYRLLFEERDAQSEP
jgi:hypothetical protein